MPLDLVEKWLQSSIHTCDVAVLMYQCANPVSLDTALSLEALLPADMPRLYLASKVDLIPRSTAMLSSSSTTTMSMSSSTSSSSSSSSAMSSKSSGSASASASATQRLLEAERRRREVILSAHERVLEKATLHLRENNLPPVQTISAVDEGGISDAYHAIIDLVTEPEKGIPHKDSKPQSGLAGSRALVAVTAVVGLVSLSAVVYHYNKEVKDWLHTFMNSTRDMLLFGTGLTQA